MFDGCFCRAPAGDACASAAMFQPEVKKIVTNAMLQVWGRQLAATEAAKEGVAVADAVALRAARFSCKWLSGWKSRFGVSLHRTTTVKQKLPADHAEKEKQFREEYKEKVRDLGEVPLQLEGNMDETPVWFENVGSYTNELVGNTEAVVRSGGAEKKRLTAILTCFADGSKGDIMVILKRKTVPKPPRGHSFPPRMVIRANAKGWMTQSEMLVYVDRVWKNRGRCNFVVQEPSVLLMDSFSAHTTPPVLEELKRLKTLPMVIPGGLTSVLQPLDLLANRSFKAALRDMWAEWMEKAEIVDGKVAVPRQAGVRSSWAPNPLQGGLPRSVKPASFGI
eukprot:GHVU01144237.1.p1 GENE.GHVU01144237.1~~GHVU01144237.1.p1  ORF type:complete len:335 (-),score=39.26 GHVU01144237.1:112-1116(-)